MTSWFRRGASATPPPPLSSSMPASTGGPVPTGVPLELISYNEDTGKFTLGAQALQVLKQTRVPVGVVAVCGRARQGKSFILNQLLGRSGGFQVAPTHRPCTKGLWMWSTPVERVGPDGRKYALVLLDTEGIDAYDQTGQYSTQIFSLAVLLSSLFVFNQMGGIDEAALDRLSLVTEMTKHIRVRASGGEADDELAAFTPSFLWLLRDFYLKLEEDGHAVTPRDYLERALGPLRGTGRAVEAKNEIRESIKSLFPDRDCFTLVRPVNDEDALAQLDTLPQSSMRPEFREGLHRLTQLIFTKAQPKRLGTQVLSGPMLAGLVDAYVTAINNGAVPTIATAWQGVAEAESRRAADAAEAAYAAAFGGDVAADEGALESEHQRALAAAQRAFDELAIGDETVRNANEKRWKESCGGRFQQVRERKLAQAAAACERMINEATNAMAALARRDGVTLEQMEAEVAKFEAAYRSSAEATGPTKWPRFAEFMQTAYGGAVRDVAARADECRRAEAAAAAQAAEVASLKAQQAEARAVGLEAESARFRTEVTQLRSALGGAERKLAEAQAELARERQAAAQSGARVAALEAQVAALSQSKDADRASLVQQAEAQLRAAQASHQTALASLSAQQGEAVRQAGEAVLQLAAAQDELKRLKGEAASSSGDAQAWAGRYNALAAEKEGLSASVQVLSTEKAELQRAVQAAEQQLAVLQQRLQAREAEFASELRAKEEEARRAAEQAAAAAAAAVPQAAAEAAPALGSGEDDGFQDAVDVLPGLPDIKKMTVDKMKAWLMDQGQEAVVWELSQKRSKKTDWEAAVRRVAGQ